VSRVAVVVAAGHGSMAQYGRELAARLPLERVDTDVNLRSADRFGIPSLGREAARALGADAAFARRLRALGAVPHLTHHHTLRHAHALGGRPFVATVHDLIRWRDARGETVSIAPLNARDRAGVRLDVAAARRAAAVVVPSAHTGEDVIRALGVPEERVHVVPHGVDHTRFRPDPGPRPLAAPYVLNVGSEHPRKDVVTLLHAFAALRRDPALRDLRLVRVGDPGDPEAPFAAPVRAAERELGLTGDVVHAGRVPDEELARWYAHAEVLAFPSRAEGFGLPALEAMACGCPVVASTAGSLPEVLGGAAVHAPPGDAPALARALGEVLRDPLTRLDLASRGRERAAGFSWERAARETLAAHAAALGRPPTSGASLDVDAVAARA
jgi:glycosyltransferase involved in cell wall biosynthesis